LTCSSLALAPIKKPKMRLYTATHSNILHHTAGHWIVLQLEHLGTNTQSIQKTADSPNVLKQERDNSTTKYTLLVYIYIYIHICIYSSPTLIPTMEGGYVVATFRKLVKWWEFCSERA